MLKKTRKLKHGHCLKPNGSTRVYKVWASMKSRCRHNQRYGLKGVVICDRWAESFLSFLADMGAPQGDAISLDRIDNSKGYSKENCRWATLKEQGRNKTNNVIVDILGVKRPLAAWLEYFEVKLDPETVRLRLKKGMYPLLALTSPPYVRIKCSV